MRYYKIFSYICTLEFFVDTRSFLPQKYSGIASNMGIIVNVNQTISGVI